MLNYLLLGLLVIHLLMVGIAWIRLKSSPVYQFGVDSPSISVMIAVRNEEKTISRCIKALQQLEYTGDMEFLFADDQSTDRTAEIIHQHADSDSRICYFLLEDYLPGINGKARALEYLTHKAMGQYLFITDADIRVNPGWIRQLLGSVRKGHSLVSGVTMIEGTSFFSKFQYLDWIYAQGMLKVVTDMIKPVTAIGNNMVVNAEKLESVGGFDRVKFSMTEDFAIAKALKDKGYSTGQEFNPASLGYSWAVTRVSDWFQQRKRWMTGAARLPWWLQWLLLFQAMRFTLILILCLTIGVQGLAAFVVFWIIDLLYFLKAGKILSQKISPLYVFIYQLLFGIVAPLSLMYYFWPSGIRWKERKY